MIFNKSLVALALCATAVPAFGKETNLRISPALSGNAAADGKLDEWNLNNDFVHDLIDEENNKVSAKAYAKWDCATKVLCVLVLGEAGISMDDATDNAWVKDNGDLMLPVSDFSWIQAECGSTVGWEGCYEHGDFAVDRIQIHAGYKNDGDDSKACGAVVSMDLSCEDGSLTGCGANGVCTTKDDSIAMKKRKLQDDPCIKYPNKNWHGWPGWTGQKEKKAGCDDGSEPEEPENGCTCDYTYEELQATGLCKGTQIPICHTDQGNSHETICVAISGWENGHCPQHAADFCGGCPGDDSGNGENASKNKNKL